MKTKINALIIIGGIFLLFGGIFLITAILTTDPKIMVLKSFVGVGLLLVGCYGFAMGIREARNF